MNADVRGALVMPPLVACVAACFAACGEEYRATGPASPDAAFGALRVAVERGDAAAVYDALDVESRWSVQSIHRAERAMWQLAHAWFPPGAREREEARYAAAGAAADPRSLFPSMGLHAGLGAGMGAAKRAEPRPDGTVVVETERGGRYVVARGSDGFWGFAGLREELARRKQHAARALGVMQRSADEYAHGAR